jgi:CRP-like cAMP-binding protein
MVSTELLRRFPFFSGFSPEELTNIALQGEEIVLQPGDVVFETHQSADALYLLLDGCVDLHYVAVDEINPEYRKDFFVSQINVGEPFGLSALIPPYRYVGDIRVTQPGRAIKFNAEGLRALCEADPKMDARMMRRLLEAVMSRLHDTRVLLVASRP